MTSGVGVTAPRDTPAQHTQRFLLRLERPALVHHLGTPRLLAVARGPGGRLDLQSATAQSHLRLLAREQEEAVLELRREMPQARVHWRYRVLFNGLVVRAPTGSEARLARLKHVRSVRATDRVMMRPLLDASLPLVGAPAYWQQVGGASLAGRGVKVAVIDTGIDVDNPFFDDPFASYPPGFPRGASAYTTPKVIAARAYFRPDDPVDTSRDEPNPHDHLGHGSHVAGIIAGVHDTLFDLGGYQALVSGVAPGALLMSYKVFYRSESGTEGAHEPELMAAFEDAVLDGADVINNSWGGPDVFGDADPSLEVYAAAVEAGVTVVFAAGNEGPGDGSVAAPGQHHRFITVANSGTGRGFSRYLDVVAPEPVPEALRGVPMTVGRISASLGSGVGPARLLPAHLVDSGGNETACAPFSPGVFDGAVALVVRGGCTFSEKVIHAVDASAIAVVVQNNDPVEDPFAMSGDDVPVPAVMVSYASGEALGGFCEAHADAQVALRPGWVPFDTSGRDEVTYSSSRGPTAAGRLKPDLAAPGSPILSADAHPVGSTSTQAFAWKSGTSMASPHVAGAAAIVRQRHPSWTPAQVKSALVGLAARAGITTWVGGAASPNEMGAGRLRMDDLLRVRLLASPAVVDGVELFPGEERTVTVTLQRALPTITSVSLSLEDVQTHSDLSVVLGTQAPFDDQGVATVALHVSAMAGADPGDRTGFLLMDDDEGGRTLVPFLLRVVPAAPERDLLVVDLAFAEDNGTPDYAAWYGELAEGLGLDWERATANDLVACPTVPLLERFRAVLAVTGDDRWSQHGTVARWTLDRLSAYLLRGGRLLVAGQGPLRDPSHERVVALMGSITLAEPPWFDEGTGGLRPQSEYRAVVVGAPALATAPLDLTSGLGELSQVGELAGVQIQLGVDPWSLPLLRLTEGSFQGAGDVGRAYDPFSLWGLDRLAEAHRHRAVMLGFGLELVREPEPTGDGTPTPGSAGEVLERAFRWVSDRVSLAVDVLHDGLDVTLVVTATADSGEVTSFWFDAGDGSAPRDLTGGPIEHRFPAYGHYEVTLVARSETGAAALFRRLLTVQPAPPGSDAGAGDGGTPVDAADATIIEGRRQGCGCRGGGGGGGVGLLLLGLAGLLALRRRGGNRRRGADRAPGAMLATVFLGATWLAACGHEAGRLKDAYEEVIDYSIEYRSKTTVWKERKLPGFVWAVRENRDVQERPAIEVDIAVPMDAPVELWKSRLEEAARAASVASSLEVVRVQAWPRGLVSYGGLVGTALLAKDGRGWDGTGNTFREVLVLSGHDKGVYRPSAFDLEVLAALEKRRSILLKDPAHERRRGQWSRSPDSLDRDVAAVEAPRLGLTQASVEASLANARKFFWKPRWQPSPLLPSQ